MKGLGGKRPDRRHLETFLAVIDSGSFAAAGRELNISQSAVSASLRQLEARIGSELFVRTARPFTLTAAGRSAEPHARRAVREHDAFVAAATGELGATFGRLTICTIPTLSAHPVAQLVGRFRSLHPRVRVDIVQPESRSIADVPRSVRDGHADVGITEFPAGSEGLRSHEFAPQEFVAVLPPDSPHEEPVIDATTFVSYGLIVGPWFETSATYVTLEKLSPGVLGRVTIRTAHRESFQHLVARGLGVSILHKDHTRTARHLGCKVVELRPRLVRRAGLLYPGGYLPPAAAAFVTMCRELEPPSMQGT